MATIHIDEIHRILLAREPQEMLPGATELSFLEIRFDKPGSIPAGVVDEEFQDKVLTVNSSYGVATIQFDATGQLRSIDFS